MVAELGHLSLILAFCFSMLLMTLPLAGSYFKKETWASSYRSFVLAQFVFVGLAYLSLTYSFISNDFTVLYVASNSSINLPWWYKLCAVWGAHEGSMLLWVSILSLWMMLVTFVKNELDREYLIHVLAVLAFISAGFFLFLLTTSNPFLRLLRHVPVNGQDLNPLLQDPGFLFHPPTLYMGYVGFSVAFAFAISSLIIGRVETKWAKWTRPWSLAAWCFLTLGITLGSSWAYRELGWGGWWFWDPVENASFMPWLSGTALIHSLSVTEKRKHFKAWTILLALTTFSLSLLGTFLVRSGVLTSVHAFAVSPGRGLFMLVFLFVVIGASLLIYALRANAVRKKADFSVLSRETLLMLNNVFLAVTMLTVLLGTLYPLVIDALGLGKLSVGSPYFNQMFVYLMTPFLFILGLGPLSQWKKMPTSLLLERVKTVLLAAVGFGVALPLILMGSLTPWCAIGVILGLWCILATLYDVFRHYQTKGQLLTTRAYWGMVSAHLGVGVVTLGITLSSSYGIEDDVRAYPGKAFKLGAYTLKMTETQDVVGPNYKAVEAHFNLYQNGQQVSVLKPQKRIYDVGRQVKGDSAIDIGLFRDIYVAMGNPLEGQAWSVRLYYKPFVRWIWAGGFMILIGGFLALSDKRYYQIKTAYRLKEALAHE